MTSWPEEILDAFAEYFEVLTQPEFKTAMKSKPGNTGLSVCVERERKEASKHGVQKTSSDYGTQFIFLGLSPGLGKVFVAP